VNPSRRPRVHPLDDRSFRFGRAACAAPGPCLLGGCHRAATAPP